MQNDPWPNIEGTQFSPVGQACVESQSRNVNPPIMPMPPMPIPNPIPGGERHWSGLTHADMTIGAPIPKVPLMQHPSPPVQSGGPEHFNMVALPVQVIDGSWQRPVFERGL